MLLDHNRKRRSRRLISRDGIKLWILHLNYEGQIGNKKVETKQISVPQKSVQNDFFKELCSIRGIGKKTADDITKIFPDREELIKKIRLNSNKNALPFREDACVALIKRYKYGS